jgi:anti-sigma regulatory factor (Ser/Thr protein kinase)
MELPMRRINLEVESKLSHVSLVAVAIRAISIHAGLDPGNASQTELSVVEAVTNVITHAYLGQPDQRILVTVSYDTELLRFDLYDSGKLMPAETIDRLVRGRGIVESENLELASIPESGRGLGIIHRTMDEIFYERDGDRNHLQLTRRIHQR